MRDGEYEHLAASCGLFAEGAMMGKSGFSPSLSATSVGGWKCQRKRKDFVCVNGFGWILLREERKTETKLNSAAYETKRNISNFFLHKKCLKCKSHSSFFRKCHPMEEFFPFFVHFSKMPSGNFNKKGWLYEEFSFSEQRVQKLGNMLDAIKTKKDVNSLFFYQERSVKIRRK